jgi:hypothetical protein
MRAPSAFQVSVLAVLSVIVGCTDFDREDRIEDTRVLAIEAWPPEILYSPLFLTPAGQRPFPLPSVDVQVRVRAYDPRGGRTKTTIQLCPEGAGDSTCRLYDPTQDIAKEPAAAQADVRAVLTPRTFDGTIAEDAAPIGRIEPDTFNYTFSPGVIDFLIDDDANGQPIFNVFPALPRFVVEVENLDFKDKTDRPYKERAFKRLPVALDLTSPDLPPQVITDIARGLGYDVCTADNDPLDDEEFEQIEAACLARRVPNTNPAFIGFKLEPDPEELTEGYLYGDTPELARGSLLNADPGAVVALTPVLTEGTVERYQVLSFNLEDSKLLLLNREEDFAFNWYSTRGDVSSEFTAIQFNTKLGVTWQLPADAEPGERDSLYLVILDQRGGTSFGQVTVQYR